MITAIRLSPLESAAIIIRTCMQSVSIVFFFLKMAISAPPPSNVLTDDASAGYERVVRDNLVVSDLFRVILWMMTQRL